MNCCCCCLPLNISIQNIFHISFFFFSGIFDWHDPFQLDASLTEDEIAIRDSLRSFCKEKLLPQIIEANRHESELMNKFDFLQK